MRHFPLGLLPPELLTRTFDHLTTSEKCSLAKVSRKFRSVVIQELTRPTRLSEICVDFSKEILVVLQNDLSWIVLTCKSNEDGGVEKAKESVFLLEDMEEKDLFTFRTKKLKRKRLSSVFFMDVDWNAYIGQLFKKLNNTFQEKPLQSLRVFLPDDEIPLPFLQCTARCEELEIKRNDDKEPPPQELMPLIRRATRRLKLDYVLTLSQIEEFALSHIKCSVTGENALKWMQDFYSKSVPEKAFNWTFAVKGEIRPIYDMLLECLNSTLTSVKLICGDVLFLGSEREFRASEWYLLDTAGDKTRYLGWHVEQLPDKKLGERVVIC